MMIKMKKVRIKNLQNIFYILFSLYHIVLLSKFRKNLRKIYDYDKEKHITNQIKLNKNQIFCNCIFIKFYKLTDDVIYYLNNIVKKY